MRRILVGLLALGLLATALAGCGGSAKKSDSAAKEFKVAFVEFATASGSAWVKANVEGSKLLEKNVPGVKTTVVENVQEGPGVVTVLRQLAQAGNQVIFCDAYGYAEFVPQVAKEFPNVKFINQQGIPADGPNVASYDGYLEQGRYLEGIIAGYATKSNTIGFVAAHPFPPVIAGVNAFALGVQSVNPKAVVKVVWVNSWYDPPKEKEAADALLNAGADVVATHTDSDAALKAAAAKGKYGMTSSADWSASAPQAILAGNAWNWGNFYTKAVKQVQDGTWKPGRYVGSLADGVVGLTAFGPGVSADAKAAVEKAKKDLISGSLHIFKGPLSDNTGKVQIAAGQEMSLDETGGKMNWLIKGVEGNVK